MLLLAGERTRGWVILSVLSRKPDAEDAEEALLDDEAGQMRCSVFASASIGLLSYAGSVV